MSGFVHLRVHTEFSLTDGVVRVEPPKRKGGGVGATLTSRAAELKFPAIAVTDINNLFAMVKFYKAAEGAGIKPVIGADIRLEERVAGEAPERLTLLVQNDTGYRNLTKLISLAYTDGQQRGTPLVKREWLAPHAEGLIALTGRDGSTFRAAAGDQVEAAKSAVAELSALYPQRLYLEISRCQRPGDEEWVQAACALSRHFQVPVVATNDVRFLSREEFDAHEARVCIAQGRVLGDDKRPRDYTPEQYLKSADEMQALFADIPEALENTLQIARRCTLTLKFAPPYHLPNFPVPEGHDTNSWLRKVSEDGLARRFTEITLAKPEEEYRQRLDYELGIIERMGFAGYFLVVADFIQWAKQNGCPVGPGRGSGAGSLVAYATRITDLDPLPYNLLFERFLNPERVSMPDFDVDFCMDNRDRVIEYVTQKYGRPHVGQIITYATMAARGVIRDVARVLGHGYGFGDRISKLVPGTPGATLVDALETVPELKGLYDTDEEVKAVVDLGLALEGTTRGVGVHAGGVVIAPRPLTDYAPLLCEPGGGGMRTQFDMKDLEVVGLVKFDFLGLKTLTVIQEAVNTIVRQHGRQLDMLALPLDDQETFRKIYQSGESSAVFQMESPGMQKASRDLKPDCFEDIIALVSLYRPGPMENIPTFCENKRDTSKIEYLHPEMEAVLQPTYGIFVYQEQVMQMSQRMAGYTLGGADLLRRAMGKKIRAEMEKQREIFTTGATGRGIDGEVASKVFDLMAKFADYGFNKSHAAAYALVSYHTAWLKAHYPAEFMAAVLSCEMQHTDSVVLMRDECLRMKLEMIPPDINRSFYRFTVPGPNQILYGLGAIKGVGEAALEGIIAEREKNGRFKDLFDFCRRIDLKKANKRVLEALIYSGALDGFGLNRPSLLATLPKALGLAEKAAQSADSGQVDLFGLGGGSSSGTIEEKVEPELAQDWLKREKLAHERDTLGFYLSGHPIDAYRDIIEQVCTDRMRPLIEQHARPPVVGADGKVQFQPRQKVMFAAWVVDIRFFKGDKSADGKSGRASYKLTFDDQTAQLSTWIDVDAWPRLQPVVKPDSLVFVIAEIGASPPREGRESEPRMYRPEFFALADVLKDYPQKLALEWCKPVADVQAMHKALKPYQKGNVGMVVHYRNGRQACVLDLAPEWKLRLDENCLTAVQQIAGPDCVKVTYKRYVPPVTERRFDRAFSGGGGGDDE
ncbi:DNA polymerase III subunit alpha [Solimonas fluminis]|uniref:DNA polymerase III subunit alpha n=1 Tax=Solimonas fluminis TaxID=2086571 RepID=A0A2S5TBC7_9GAMM|nr:DNA polymerase III subunit alpha [Solimonas fluminis]PPE72265.1 DNA polymerase III subunit alpha [Solimonas fluminis]